MADEEELAPEGEEGAEGEEEAAASEPGKGVTDDGLTWSARIAQIAAIAVAVINTKAAIDIARKQEKMAKKYLQMAKERQQYYYDVYVPRENTEIQEACSAELYAMHKDVQVGRAKASVRHELTGKTERELQCISRYCTGKRAAIVRDREVEEATALALSANFARRYEEKIKDARDDTRWARRAEALNRGRDIMARAQTFSGFAMGMFGRLGEQAANAAAGAMGYLGYSMERREMQPREPLKRPQRMGISYPLPSPELEVIPPKPQPVKVLG
ncbi:hypothetical protein ABLL84_003780 [Escherichia coli]